MKIKFFLVFIVLNISLVSQDYLSSLKSNAILRSSSVASREILSPRGLDSTNCKVEFETLQLPFLDEFSIDARRPEDLSIFPVQSEYYVVGKCISVLDYKEGRYGFSKNISTTDNFDPSNPPNFISSTPTPNPPILFTFSDTVDCNTLVSLNIYPPNRRRTYDNLGNILTDTFISDTFITAAHVKEYFLKRYKWIDRHAYVNKHFPYLPPSKGVATLDGLNEFGKPYDAEIVNAYGLADYLTSVPIDLSAFSASDSAYLSFMYQPQGYGDWPDFKDSLMVEFLDDRGNWNVVSTIHGLNRAQSFDTMIFKHQLILIPDPIVASDPIYYFAKFQFRFKNFATTSGNNDHWHIDFVRLDTGRDNQDTLFLDQNFVYELPTVLKRYSLLPSQQYRGADDLKDSVIATNRNINTAVLFSDYKFSCINENNSVVYANNTSGIPFSAEPIVFHSLNVKDTLNYPTTIDDSTYIVSKIYFDNSDNIVSNDSATNRQLFFNEMAYDDGTAEMAYGIQGLGTKKVAYKFLIPNKDTLAAIKVLFSNIDEPVANLVFNLQIWKTIGIDGNAEEVIKTISNVKPQYTDKLNGFVTFGLDTPIEVQDSIYIGWVQTDDRNLQIGYDRNYDFGFDNIYIMTNSVWSKSNIVQKGSPMMRLILDGVRDFRSSKIAEATTPIQSAIVQVFPNPVSNSLNLLSTDYEQKEAFIYDLMGKLVSQSEFSRDIKIDVSKLNSGIYILKLSKNGIGFQMTKLGIQR